MSDNYNLPGQIIPPPPERSRGGDPQASFFEDARPIIEKKEDKHPWSKRVRINPQRTWSGKIVYPDTRKQTWNIKAILRLVEKVYDPKRLQWLNAIFPREMPALRVSVLILLYTLKPIPTRRAQDNGWDLVYKITRTVILSITQFIFPDMLQSFMSEVMLPESRPVADDPKQFDQDALERIRAWIVNKAHLY